MKKIALALAVALCAVAFNASALSWGVVGGAGFGSQASSTSGATSGVMGQSSSALLGATGGFSAGSANSNGAAGSGILGTNTWSASTHTSTHQQGNANGSLGLAGTTQTFETSAVGQSSGNAGFGAFLGGGIFGP